MFSQLDRSALRRFQALDSHRRSSRFLRTCVFAVAAAVAALLLPSLALAQNYSATELGWDPSGSVGAASGGGGTWDNVSNYWYNGSIDTTWASGDTADFTGTGSTVTIAGGGVTAGAINFYSSGYTIAGADNTATLTLGGGSGTPTINLNGNSATISAGISGTAGLVFNGGTSGILTIGNGTNSNPGVNFTGNTTVNSGTLRFVDAINFESGASADTISVASGATINFYVDSSGTGFGNDGANEALGTTTSGQTTVITGGGTFQKTGNGILALGGQGVGNAITFDLGAGAVIDVEGGTLRNGGWAGAVWTNNLASLNIASGATFDMWDGHEVVVDALTGAGFVDKHQSSGGTELLEIGINNGSGTFSGAIQNTDTAGGGVGLIKTGTGTEILTGTNNTYIGGTTINGGTLQIGDGGTSNGSLPGNVTVNSPGTLAFANPTAFSFPGLISGTGSLRRPGPGRSICPAALPQQVR